MALTLIASGEPFKVTSRVTAGGTLWEWWCRLCLHRSPTAFLYRETAEEAARAHVKAWHRKERR